MVETGSTERQLDPRQALVAALPPLLFGLGVLVNALLVSLPSASARWYVVPTWRLVAGIGSGLLSAAVLLVGGSIALLRGLPDWGYTWAGAGFAALALGLNVVAEERAELGLSLAGAWSASLPSSPLASPALLRPWSSTRYGGPGSRPTGGPRFSCPF